MSKDVHSVDVLVIGGGPGGATASTVIAMQGHSVLLLERDQFPRHQIGESLLPHTLGICKLLGVLDEVEAAGFTPKNGGVWYWGSCDKPGWGFDFGEAARPPSFGKHYAYQVERHRFDEILLRNAQRKGVDVRQRHKVEELIEDNGRIVGAHYTDAEGGRHTVKAKYVVDAGGHSSPHYRLTGERVFADRFRNLALYCYYAGGKRLPAPQQGSILNVSFDKGWFWYIPLSPTLTSVGAVISIEYAELLKQGYGVAMQQFIDSCPKIKEYIGDTPRVTEGMYGEYRVRKDWSYCNSKFWRPGLVLVGDVACFVDPLFSSGIHLSTYSALLAARSINTALKGDAIAEDQLFREFEERYRYEYYTFYEFLAVFYDTNRDKEEYFAQANRILQTKHTDRQAFVSLVSGFSSEASSFFENRSAESDTKGKPGADPNAIFTRAVVDIHILAKTGEAQPVPSATNTPLVPSKDGFHWMIA